MRHLRIFALALIVSPSPLVAAEPLRVLFLGDQGHHRPSERAAQLIPVMATRGIEITYTENTADLNLDKLSKYDALVIYANTTQIAPSEEKALLEYVTKGGGFVPLHCASYCFLNSPAYIALVGAQFQRHGTGEFDTKVVDAQHPITKGLEPFHTWDETYVHTKLNNDRHDLQTRAEGDRQEPWTWIRNQGKGRVFYTAYGHDHRTWGHPGFQDLIERGIRWAANKGEVFDSRPRVASGLKPFEYEPAKIPFYLPSQRWGTQGAAINKMQRPVPAAESVKHMAVPDGFEVKLFATEPQIGKPITMAWDHRGRLWVAETVDYPNELQRPGEGRDRISILEDTDGDGQADKFTVFADKLSIPTSIAFANGGIVVFSPPNTLFLKDTDGDDRADERKVLFTGWGTQDTHAGPSNMRYGLDNWIYGIVGYSGFLGEIGGETHNFRQGLYRFRPDGSKLEFLRNTNNNSWGVGFSEDGLLFGSTANGCPSVYLPIPNRYYESVRGWSPSVLANIADSNRFFPITDKVRQVDWHGGFTAGAGHALYTARTYPKPYWNSTAFVTEPTGHLVATFSLERRGSDVASHNLWNLVASDDEWTSPILADVGPDGNVWIIDWYNFIVQHNPTPQGHQTGKGNAYVTPLRDKTHGRIYRIVAKGVKPSATKPLDPNDGPGLVAALKSDNMLWRMHAQRLLVERGKNDVVPDLIRLVDDPSVDDIGLNPAAIHALWTLSGLGVFDKGPNGEATATSSVLAALSHSSAGVRRNALHVLPQVVRSRDDVLKDASILKTFESRLGDKDGQVRLAAWLALADMPKSKSLAELMVVSLASGRADNDRWLPDAATSAAAAHDALFLSALAAYKFERTPSPAVLSVAGRVAEHYARGGPADSVGSLMVSLGGSDKIVGDIIVFGLAKGWPKDRPVTFDEATEKALVMLLGKVSPEAKGQLIGLADRWGSKAIEKYTSEIAGSFLASAKDSTKPEDSRVDAAKRLIDFRKSDAQSAGELLKLITPRTSSALASGIVAAVSQSESAKVGPAILEALPVMTPSVRAEALRALLGRAEWTSAFMTAVEEGNVQLAALSLDQKQALATHPDKSIARRAKALLDRGGGLPDADRQKVIEQLSPIVLKGGDPARGKQVFTQQCAKCHTHSGEGGKVGPDLTGMAAHSKEELLVHMIDPSRSVEGNFVAYTVATTDGRVLNGLLASESKTAIELVDAEGKTNKILREDIDELAASKKSLMPDGFEKQVPSESIADVLAFLTQRGKYLPLDLRKVATIVSTKGMFFDADSSVERLVFPDWSPKTFEGVPFHLVDPQGDRVPNVVMLYGPQGNFPPKMPRSVSLPCNMPAKAIHFLSGVSGWGAGSSDVRPSTSMIVRLHYSDGQNEDHPLRNGIHFADYIRQIDVPGSKLAFPLRGQQIRYLAIEPKRTTVPIERIELVKGNDPTAPIVMAVTVEGTE
jgi:uncharacterized protein